jgi:hypothetical protein
MKRLQPAYAIVALLVFAATAIPTSSSALSEYLELEITYYDNGSAVGGTVYNVCGVWPFDYSWGQQGGTLKKERYTDCRDGSASCYWYSWSGSDWELLTGPECLPDGSLPDRDRPRY